MTQNLWCVGRNYREHAKELGHEVPTTRPMIFLKAGSCIVSCNEAQSPKNLRNTERQTSGQIRLPQFSQDVHHEVELVLRFNDQGKFDAMAIGLDLTIRDVQIELKKMGHPWTLSKSFRDSAPLGPWIDISSWNADGTDWPDLEIRLHKNNQLVQSGKMSEMVFAISELAQYIWQNFPVVAGDALFTGTPPGVGLIASGDHLKCEIVGYSSATWTVI